MLVSLLASKQHPVGKMLLSEVFEAALALALALCRLIQGTLQCFLYSLPTSTLLCEKYEKAL